MLRQPPASSLLYCSSRRGTELSVYELWKHGAWKKNWWDSQDGNSQDAAQKLASMEGYGRIGKEQVIALDAEYMNHKHSWVMWTWHARALCAHVLRRRRVCPACGPARFREGAKYCDECGHKLSNGATSHVRSRSPHQEVIIEGHRKNGTAELRFSEDTK